MVKGVPAGVYMGAFFDDLIFNVHPWFIFGLPVAMYVD